LGCPVFLNDFRFCTGQNAGSLQPAKGLHLPADSIGPAGEWSICSKRPMMELFFSSQGLRISVFMTKASGLCQPNRTFDAVII
jgi:hypothetical protein